MPIPPKLTLSNYYSQPCAAAGFLNAKIHLVLFQDKYSRSKPWPYRLVVSTDLFKGINSDVTFHREIEQLYCSQEEGGEKSHMTHSAKHQKLVMFGGMVHAIE